MMTLPASARQTVQWLRALPAVRGGSANHVLQIL